MHLQILFSKISKSTLPDLKQKTINPQSVSKEIKALREVLNIV
jgi:hypothetical protein